MRAATYSDRPTWQATTRPVHDMTRDREELNEVRVIKKLVTARAVLSIQLVGGDAPIVGPVVWADIHNIALEISGEIRVYLKTSIESWTYDKKVAH